VTLRFVLVHGLRTSHSMWRPQVEALEAARIPVIAVDLPGHGRRIGEAFATDAAIAAIDEGIAEARVANAAPGPVVLAGLSLGGFFAIEYAGRHPERIDGLLALGCTTRPNRLGLALYRSWSVGMASMPHGGRRVDEVAQRLLLGPQAAVDIMAGGHGIAAAADAVAAVADLAPLDSLRRAAARGLPVWFVNGRFDHFRLEERRFHAAVPGSFLTVVPGASHMVNLARPQAVSRLMLGIARAAS